MALQKISCLAPHKRAHSTNPVWLLAETVALATQTTPGRWLRVCRDEAWAVRRALIDLAELSARNPAAYFQWLLKKYQTESRRPLIPGDRV